MVTMIIKEPSLPPPYPRTLSLNSGEHRRQSPRRKEGAFDGLNKAALVPRRNTQTQVDLGTLTFPRHLYRGKSFDDRIITRSTRYKRVKFSVFPRHTKPHVLYCIVETERPLCAPALEFISTPNIVDSVVAIQSQIRTLGCNFCFLYPSRIGHGKFFSIRYVTRYLKRSQTLFAVGEDDRR